MFGQVTYDKIYGYTIDLNNPDPETAVSYTDDAVGITPGNGWDDEPIFGRIRPLLYKRNATIKDVGYLNLNNYTEFMDGTPADITSGESGDVYVDFPAMYIQISEDTENNMVTVRLAMKAKDGFVKLKRRLVSAYLNDQNNSLSGKTIYKKEPQYAFQIYRLEVARTLDILT